MKLAPLFLLFSLPVSASTLVAINFDVVKGNCDITDIEDGVIAPDPKNNVPAEFRINGTKPEIVLEHIDIQPVTELDETDLSMAFNIGYKKTISEMRSVGVKDSLLENDDNEIFLSSKEPAMKGIVELYFDVKCD